jgi:hypothetical protein
VQSVVDVNRDHKLRGFPLSAELVGRRGCAVRDAAFAFAFLAPVASLLVLANAAPSTLLALVTSPIVLANTGSSTVLAPGFSAPMLANTTPSAVHALAASSPVLTSRLGTAHHKRRVTVNALVVMGRSDARCEHGARPSECRHCGGTAICKHGRIRRQCKECGGSGICVHQRKRADCGGSQICVHTAAASAWTVERAASVITGKRLSRCGVGRAVGSGVGKRPWSSLGRRQASARATLSCTARPE